MADERELIAERERKVAELRAAGANPYANVIARFPNIEAPPEGEKSAEVVLLSEDRFTIAGRIVAHRGFGKAAFVKLRDRTGELQVHIKKDKVGDAAYELFRKMERGDFIGTSGPAFVTRTGELT